MGAAYEVARVLEEVIAAGHSPAIAWSYTPRQLDAWAELARRRKSGEAAEFVSYIAVGSRADEKIIKSTLKRLSEESR